MGTGFFPLDKELGLGPVALLPHVHQALVRLGTCLPFAQVAEHLEQLFGVHISEGSVCRETERVGRGCLAVHQQQAEPLAACPQDKASDCMVMSADGAFVPLVHGQWAEVKLLAVGEVNRPQGSKQNPAEVFTEHLSYFARLAEVARFSDQASSEIRRRGVDRAKVVVAVQDGAEWVQTVVQEHRTDAVRILDFAHAAGHIAAIGDQVRLLGQSLPTNWLETLLHQLKHEETAAVLQELHTRSKQVGEPEEIEEHVRYLCKRTAQMDYPRFQANGWPIGSGMVESGNKLVMQARLKGAGMHWVPENVNPMLALRMNLCNQRWKEGWADQQKWQQAARESKRRQRHQQRLHVKEQHTAELRALVAPPVAPALVEIPKPKIGRTEAQKRWGRQPFSPRMLRQGSYAKI